MKSYIITDRIQLLFINWKKFVVSYEKCVQNFGLLKVLVSLSKQSNSTLNSPGFMSHCKAKIDGHFN